jgi:hypothetical protein
MKVAFAGRPTLPSFPLFVFIFSLLAHPTFVSLGGQGGGLGYVDCGDVSANASAVFF